MKPLIAIAALMASLFAAQALAQTAYPNRPVKLVVPYAAGGASDVLARVVAQGISDKLGQQVIVENKAGAGIVVGTEFVARSRPDGYTLLITTLAHATSPSLFKKLPYDTIHDLEPIAMVATLPLVLCVNPNLIPATDLKGVIEFFRANPGKYNYSSGGKGSVVHLASELFNSQANLQIQHIPYKGGAPAMTALLSGDVAYYIDVVSTAQQFVKSKRVNAIAVTSSERSHVFPDTPTMKEGGLSDYDAYTWNVVLVPRGLLPAITAKLNAVVNAAVADPAVSKRLLDLGAKPVTDSTPESLEPYIRAEMVKWARIIKASGIQPE